MLTRMCHNKTKQKGEFNMAIIEPFDLSTEKRRQFYLLFARLKKAIWQKPKQPRPMLRLLPPSSSAVSTVTPEHNQGESIEEDARGDLAYVEELQALALELVTAARAAATVLNWLVNNVPSPAWPAEIHDPELRLTAVQAAIERAEVLDLA